MQKLVIYQRIKELKKEIERYENLLESDDKNKKYYLKKIESLVDMKNFNEAIYYETGAIQ